MDLFSALTSLVLSSVVRVRQTSAPIHQVMGADPNIPKARKQRIPTVKIPFADGWKNDTIPVCSHGLKVSAFAKGLDHPRWIEVLPSGDVLVAESHTLAEKPRKPIDRVVQAKMRRVEAIGKSANRVTLLQDKDGDGVAESRAVIVEDQNQPFGMALIDRKFYLGTADGISAFDYDPDTNKLTSDGEKLVTFKSEGHWTRSLIVSPDQTKIYAGVGSRSNIAEHGLASEEGRAAIWELDVASGKARIYASGLRNPVGTAWEPTLGKLWTVVNERIGLGDETPPDYLTSVKDGGFYGWPYCYWGQTIDPRVRPNPDLVAQSITPDYALGGQTASSGLCWLPEGTLPHFGEGMVVSQHGSSHRSHLSGYKLIFIPFANGKPSGMPRDILRGFLCEKEKRAYGRPFGVAIGPDRKSLLLADELGGVIWRITSA